MTDNITPAELTDTPKPVVLCDTCGWREEVASNEAILDWHRKACPQCGGGEIVNDAEYVILCMVLACNRAYAETTAPDAVFESIPIYVKEGRN